MEHRLRQAGEEGVSQPDRCLVRGQAAAIPRLESDALQGGLAASLPASLPLQSNPNRKGFSALRHRKEVRREEIRMEWVREIGRERKDDPFLPLCHG